MEFLEGVARIAEMKDLTFGAVDKKIHPTDLGADDDLLSEEKVDGRGSPAMAADDEPQMVMAVVLEQGAPGEGPLQPRLRVVVEQLLKFLKAIDGCKKKTKKRDSVCGV